MTAEDEDEVVNQAKSKCEGYLKKALKDYKINYIREALSKRGDPMNDDAFECIQCEAETTMAGYLPTEKKILICENVIEKYNISKQFITEATLHELVHAYDDARAHVDWTNCLQIACSEIRAANLSGDCRWKNEFNRGNFKLKNQGSECIRRRATLSVASHEQCKEKAKEFVEKVYESCILDHAPFFNR